jgi:hypothetical protein
MEIVPGRLALRQEGTTERGEEINSRLVHSISPSAKEN